MANITSTCVVSIFVAVVLTVVVMYWLLKKPFKSGFTSLIFLLATLIASVFSSKCLSYVEVQASLGGIFTFDGQYQPLNLSFSIEAFKYSVIAIMVGMLICLVGISGASYLDQRKASG
jgi:K+-sensing histidine kinase KdpD